jgi:hypothetical protein
MLATADETLIIFLLSIQFVPFGTKIHLNMVLVDESRFVQVIALRTVA